MGARVGRPTGGRGTKKRTPAVDGQGSAPNSCREIERALEVLGAVHQRGDSDEAIREIVRLGRRLTGAASCRLTLLGPGGDPQRALQAVGRRMPGLAELCAEPAVATLLRKVLRPHQVGLTNDLAESALGGRPAASRRLPENLLLAPVVVDGRREAVLELAGKPGGFLTFDRRAAEALAGQVAAVLRLSRRSEVFQHAEQRYHAVAAHVEEAIVSVDGKGKIVSWNPAAEGLFGYRAEEMTERTLVSLIPPRYRRRHRLSLQRAAAPARTFTKRFPALIGLRKDGSEFPISLTLVSWSLRQGVFFTAFIRNLQPEQESEQALRLSEARFSTLVKNLEDFVLIIDRDGRILSINRVVAGLTKKEILGTSALEYVAPEYRPAASEGIQQAFRTGRPAHFEVRAQGSGEEPAWYESVVVPLAGGGQAGRAILVGRDITERRRTEEELRRHRDHLEALVEERTADQRTMVELLRQEIEKRNRGEQNLRASNEILEGFFNTTHLLIAHLDREFTFLRVNRALAEAAGRPQDSFSGKRLFSLFPRSENRENFQRVVETGEPYSTRGRRFEDPDQPEKGVSYWDWTLTPIKDAAGRVESLILSMLDVTRHERAEWERKAERSRIYAVLEQLPSAIHLITPTLAIPFANRTFREAFGDPTGKFCYQIFYGRDHACDECPALRVLESGQMERFEVIRSNGRTYDVQLSPFQDTAWGKMVLERALDVTDRKQAEASAAEARQRLESQRVQAIHADRLRSLGEMAAGIAHELNQPLVGIRGLAEHVSLALDRGWEMSPAELAEKARLIVAQADRMSHVIERTRLFGRDSDRAEMLPLEINEVIESSLAFVGAQLRASGLIWECQLSPGLPPVRANPFSLEEVILNLVSNARDALAGRDAGREGQVRIRTSLGDEPGSARVIIEVSDNGRGIPPELVERVFEPFFSTKDPQKGTGLGLPIARSLVEEAGGRLELRSTPGEGTTVRISLPALPDSEESR